MSKKKKEKEYAPVYIQSSNPSKKLLKLVTSLSEDGVIVYLQSGHPNPPPCGGPGQKPC